MIRGLMAGMLTVAVAGSAAAQDAANYPDRNITFFSQGAPGSGYDLITRAVANAIEQSGLVPVSLRIENAPSSQVGSEITISRYANDPYMVSFNSIAGSVLYSTGAIDYYYKDYTPIARLISDHYALVVHPDSEIQSVEQLFDTLREDPLAFPVVGGQSDDRVFFGVLFETAGIDPTSVNYITFPNDGDATALTLEGSAGVQVSSLSGIASLLESGDLRALGFTGSERLEGSLSSVPTFIEQGLDLEWQNARYAMGGPQMPDYAVQYWQDVLSELRGTPEWTEMLVRNRWADSFLIEGLDEYLAQTHETVTSVTSALGMSNR